MNARKIPPLAGLDEASEILGWSKQHIHSYINRGVFPKPIQRLACGPVWLREQIEQYKRDREGR